MASILPKEETIIDPLYEPLKLNRYELCPHLTMLSNVSHLRYGFSPYLLFDVEGWKEVVKVIKGIDNDEKMFSWDSVPGSDSERLLKHLVVNHSFGWAGSVEIRKTDDDKTVHIVTDENSAEITIDRNEEKATLKISDGITHDLTVRRENDKLNIYEKISILECDDFIKELKKYLKILEELPVVENKDRNTLYKDLKDGRGSIKKEYESIKKKYQEILNKFLNDSNKFKENFGKIAHLFRLDYPVEVECPKRGEKRFMCEEGKIYSMKEALLRTFELRRARWLQMSGSLHTVHRASTHTRLSHQIGSMIAGVNALREIDVYPRGEVSMSLGEYLSMRGELHEFLMANFLHDIGHSPLSHVLEPNPFTELDHEEITKNLILGKAVKGDGGGRDGMVCCRAVSIEDESAKKL